MSSQVRLKYLSLFFSSNMHREMIFTKLDSNLILLFTFDFIVYYWETFHIGYIRINLLLYKELESIHSLSIGFKLEAHNKPESNMVSEPRS